MKATVRLAILDYYFNYALHVLSCAHRQPLCSLLILGSQLACYAATVMLETNVSKDANFQRQGDTLILYVLILKGVCRNCVSAMETGSIECTILQDVCLMLCVVSSSYHSHVPCSLLVLSWCLPLLSWMVVRMQGCNPSAFPPTAGTSRTVGTWPSASKTTLAALTFGNRSVRWVWGLASTFNINL
jgi:hypothetical protein